MGVLWSQSPRSRVAGLCLRRGQGADRTPHMRRCRSCLLERRVDRLYHEQLDQQKTPEDKSNLVTKEREWIKRRDEQCDIPNYNNLPPAKLCGKKDCILSQTKARAGELER